MNKTDDYLSTLAAEMRGPKIPAEAFSVADLARDAGVTLKAAYNRLAKEVLDGKLVSVVGRKPGTQRKMAYFYPARRKP